MGMRKLCSATVLAGLVGILALSAAPSQAQTPPAQPWPQRPVKFASLADFVARARAEPGKFNAAVVPGITEFTFDYFTKTAGLSVQKVPYRDIVQAATDVGEGRLQIYMSSYAILQPQTDAGRIKILVYTGR